jgi:hypothetical protein
MRRRRERPVWRKANDRNGSKAPIRFLKQRPFDQLFCAWGHQSLSAHFVDFFTAVATMSNVCSTSCNRPLDEFVEKSRIPCKRSLQDIYLRTKKLQPSGAFQSGDGALSPIADARERPLWTRMICEATFEPSNAWREDARVLNIGLIPPQVGGHALRLSIRAVEQIASKCSGVFVRRNRRKVDGAQGEGY